MRVQEQDQFHGAALTQIVEHPSFKALNKASQKYGHYLINNDRRLFVKYRKPGAKFGLGGLRRKSPQSWMFTFSSDELYAIQKDQGVRGKTFVVLVCGDQSICALTSDELWTCIGQAAQSNRWLRVEWPSGGSMRVLGQAGDLSKTIPHNSFPSKVFL